MSPDDKKIAVSLTTGTPPNRDIYVLDAVTGAPTRITTHPAVDASPVWSPDGRTIAISGGDHRTIWTVDVASTAMTQMTDGAEHAHFPWYLPDGRLAWIVEYIQQGGADHEGKEHAGDAARDPEVEPPPADHIQLV